MKKNVLLIVGLLTWYTSIAQENFISGYVIKNSGDTLFGLIDYRNWEKNPDKVSFKMDPGASQISYEPTDIKTFGVQDEIYVSAIIQMEVSPLQTSQLLTDPQFILKADTVFLQTLISGRKSLYYHKNAGSRENFYIQQGNNFELLAYKKFLIEQVEVITENNKYKGQLNFYLNDCQSISTKLANVSYQQRSLIRLFQHYYECSETAADFQKVFEKTKVEVGILAGTSLTSLTFSSSDFDYLVDGGYKSSVNFSTGLFFDFILARNQRKWSFNNELYFTSYKVKGVYEEFQNENFYTITSTEIGFSYIKLNNMVRFKYPVGNAFVFINAGISNGLVVTESNYKKVLSMFNATEKIKEGKALDDTRKHEQGWIAGIGTKYRKLSFEIRYEKANGMSDYTALKSSVTRAHFILGYRF